MLLEPEHQLQEQIPHHLHVIGSNLQMRLLHRCHAPQLMLLWVTASVLMMHPRCHCCLLLLSPGLCVALLL
jgi:hypothetical protein